MSSADARVAATPMPRRRRAWPYALGGALLAVAAVVMLWDWNWFRPLVEAQASAALGRAVTIGHFDVQLGWSPIAIADDVTVANPDGFADAPPLAHVDRLAVTADAAAYIRTRSIVLPRVEVDRPAINAVRLDDGRTNYALNFSGGSGGATPQIGRLVIADGTAHVVDPALKADFQATAATRDGGPDGKGELVAAADGTYAGQRISGHAVAGALLSLRDAAPYPIDAHMENGPTKLDLTGTVEDPLRFAGSQLRLHLSGPDLSLLAPLGGVPIPRTPNYDLTGRLDYADRKIRMTDLVGRVGSSDIFGSLAVDPSGARPVIEGDLGSHHVDLADLGGVIGSEPGRVGTPGQTDAQRRQLREAEASPQLLPTARISLPKLKSVDAHLRYKGERIVGRGVPFDSLAATVDIDDGAIRVHPAELGVGRGKIEATATLAPAGETELRMTSAVTFDHVDIGRMLEATGAVKGAGQLGGHATLESTGDSISTLVGHGDGEVSLMLAGGNLSALIVDLSGLEFGNALLSAIGLPSRATLQCFVADLPLRHGVLDARLLLAVTSEADIRVTGEVDLAREELKLRLRTDARHFSVGSVPTDIDITGKLKSPSISPEKGELAARAGTAVALGVLLTPLAALLPTVQFGTGDENAGACAARVRADGKAPTPESAAKP